MSRLEPLDRGDLPELEEAFVAAEKRLGFVPNSYLIMGRKPEILTAFNGLAQAVYREGKVPTSLKALLAHMSSRSAGCLYCMAHTAGTALSRGAGEDKIARIWEYETDAAFTEAERAALRVAQLAGQVPNGVTDEDFAALKAHYDDDQIVEIVSLIAMFGFLNRFNDTMATPLEGEPIEVGERHLAASGWSVGKHVA